MARILVVDDDVELRATVKKMLECDGHTISEAANGVEGLDVIKGSAKSEEQRIEAALIDLMMPEKDGVMLIQEALQSSPNLRIIAISGGPGGNPAWLPIAKSAGAMRVLKKPFSRDQLVATLRSVLEDPWKQ